MNISIERLQYFVNKVCTILASPMNRDFKTENPENYPDQLYNYFTGVVENIDEYGIMLRRILGKPLRTYIFIHNVVAIAEEEQLDPDNPEDAKVIEQIKQKQLEQSSKIQQQVGESEDLINPDGLDNAAKMMKEHFDTS